MDGPLLPREVQLVSAGCLTPHPFRAPGTLVLPDHTQRANAGVFDALMASDHAQAV
jgi:hypothetical protein